MSNELIFVVTLLLVYLCSSPDSAKGQLCFPTLTFRAGTCLVLKTEKFVQISYHHVTARYLQTCTGFFGLNKINNIGSIVPSAE